MFPYLSTPVLLTALLLLVLSAPAWAQGGDEPTSGEEPTVRAQGSETGGENPSAEGSTSGSDNCHPNYRGACLDPNADGTIAADDYDCEGGEGNGPRFVRGPLRVVGDDPFELDDNRDGVACEETSGAASGGGGADSDDDTAPSGSVDSGYGPVVPEAGPPLPLIGGGLGVLALVAFGIVRTRRAG